MQEASPADPTGYFALALAHWWQLETRLGEYTRDEENRFMEAANTAIDAAEKAVHREPKNAQAYLCLGGAYGLKGRWHAAKHNWLRALFDGRRARRYQTKALELDPNLDDAYLGVGLFDYYVAALPGIIRALSFLGKGDKQRGLDELDRAAANGLFSRTAAQLILVGIYANTEKKPEVALEIVKKLRAEYPQSPFMHELEILILFDDKQGKKMKPLAEEFLVRCRSSNGFYSSRALTKAYDHMGAADGLLGEWDEAVSAYTQALQEARSTDPYWTAAHLHRGEAYDVLGRRENAVEDYREALKGPDLWELKAEASRYLKTPFQPSGPLKAIVPSLENQP